jgi:glycosyltransferase involved in cell wall biosynthesis
MKASIVIPAYNEEKYIAGSLAAIVKQDALEVIVVDNASTDNTFSIAGQFRNVKVIREQRKGVQYARETGRKKAKGSILAYLDADSIPPRNWLRKGLIFFLQPDVIAVSGPCDYYDASPFFRFISLLFQKTLFRVTHFVVHDVFGKGGVMLGGNVLIRANALEKIGGFDTSIVFYGDDTDTARRLTAVGKVLFRNSMTVRSSARRFKGSSVVKVTLIYIINFIWVILFKRPFSGTGRSSMGRQ